MGCLFSLPETNLILDEYIYIPPVDLYTETYSSDYEAGNLFFLCD